MKDHRGDEVVFGSRLAYGAHERSAAAAAMLEVDGSVTMLRERIQQAAPSRDAPAPRHVGLWILAVAAPIGASVIGAMMFSIT